MTLNKGFTEQDRERRESTPKGCFSIYEIMCIDDLYLLGWIDMVNLLWGNWGALDRMDRSYYDTRVLRYDQLDP